MWPASQMPFPMPAPADLSIRKESFFQMRNSSGSVPYKKPSSVIAPSQGLLCSFPKAEQGLMFTEEDLGERFAEVAFFGSGRQVCFLWEPRENCLGNLLTALCHFAEAVGARCSCLRWGDHCLRDAGCSSPCIPEVSAFPLQSSAHREGGFPAPARECASSGLNTQHRVRDQS